MAESKLRTLSIDFAVQILNLVKFLIYQPYNRYISIR